MQPQNERGQTLQTESIWICFALLLVRRLLLFCAGWPAATVAPHTVLHDPGPEVDLVHPVTHTVYTVELVVHFLDRGWLLPAATRMRQVQHEMRRQHHHFYSSFEQQMKLQSLVPRSISAVALVEPRQLSRPTDEVGLKINIWGRDFVWFRRTVPRCLQRCIM